mmetsp:Transcript_46764/g.111219  ORF Transcript_46764/g.111219 Transcript_46764/m.111219 type:complete len:316 (+) Transcript_46764:48-995(+)
MSGASQVRNAMQQCARSALQARSLPELQTHLAAARQAGRSIGFVPTMGGLHAGHGELVRASSSAGHFTVASVFVNPAQFGPNEDFSAYPRTEEADRALAEEAGADVVWYPQADELYPFGKGQVGSEVGGMLVDPGPLGRILCGASRPDFFPGICTVVLKFFTAVRPDVAFFGEKDWQQLALIRRLAKDFLLPTQVVGVPTQRDSDGLAMSTRNKYLRSEDRPVALSLVGAIRLVQKEFREGRTSASACSQLLQNHWPERLEVDYADFRDGDTLQPVDTLDSNSRLFLASWLEVPQGDGRIVRVRLIDNGSVAGDV